MVLLEKRGARTRHLLERRQTLAGMESPKAIFDLACSCSHMLPLFSASFTTSTNLTSQTRGANHAFVACEGRCMLADKGDFRILKSRQAPFACWSNKYRMVLLEKRGARIRFFLERRQTLTCMESPKTDFDSAYLCSHMLLVISVSSTTTTNLTSHMFSHTREAKNAFVACEDRCMRADRGDFRTPKSHQAPFACWNLPAWL